MIPRLLAAEVIASMPLFNGSTHPIHIIHRVGSAVLGLGLWVFAALGFSQGLAFFSTQGPPVLGLSSNGFLSTISVAAGALLLVAAALGGPTASTATAVLGVAFLVSGLAHFAIINTSVKILAFRLPNVFFSIIAGLLLLFFGTYGRVTGGLPEDNPYHHHGDHPDKHYESDVLTEEESNEKRRLIDAEMAFGEGHATPEQQFLVRREQRRQQQRERQRIANNVDQKRRIDRQDGESPPPTGGSHAR